MNAEEITKRYANPHYFEGTYDKAALANIKSIRQDFPLQANTVYKSYMPNAISRYLFIGENFNSNLEGKILDVGSRNTTMRDTLHKNAELVDKHNSKLPPFDWERERLPYADRSFDTVVCMDTLEHINDIHAALEDLFRVSKRYVIISLPNMWRKTFHELLSGTGRMASYGLPPEKPHDRHKWHFNTEDAERFLFYNAAKNGFRVVNVKYNAPKTRLWHRVAYPIIKMLPERYAKNFLVITIFVALERHSA